MVGAFSVITNQSSYGPSFPALLVSCTSLMISLCSDCLRRASEDISALMDSASPCFTSNCRLRGSSEVTQPWHHFQIETDRFILCFMFYLVPLVECYCWALLPLCWQVLDTNCAGTDHLVHEALARDGRGSPVGAAWARPPPLGALHLLLNICIV